MSILKRSNLAVRSGRPAAVSGLADDPADSLATCQELIDAIPVIVWRANPKTYQFTFVSKQAEALFGYPAPRWTDEPAFWIDHIYAEDREFILTRRADALRTTRAWDLEYRVIAADARVLWVRELGRVISGELVGVIIDLSKKRSAQEVLGESRLWLRQLIDAIPEQIWSGPADGTIDFCNARWRSELGFTVDDLQGAAWQKMLHPGDRDRVLQAWRYAVLNGTAYEQEERHRTADGRYIWFLCRGEPQRDEHGHIVRWYGANTNIESQKRAEDKLRKSEQRWHAVFDNALVGVALMDASMHHVALNGAYQKMVGYPLEELHSMSGLDLIHEDDRRTYQNLYSELLAGKRDRFEMENRYRRKDGEILWVRVNGSLLPASPGESPLWVLKMVEDITERKRLRDELQRERDRLRLLLDLTHQFVAKPDFRDFLDTTLAALRELAGWEVAMISVPDSSVERLRVYATGGTPIEEFATIPVEGSLQGSVLRSGQYEMFRTENLPMLSPVYAKTQWLQDWIRTERLKSGCILPLVYEGNTLGVLFLATSAPLDSTAYDLEFLQELAALIAAVMSNARRYGELTWSHERLASEKTLIEEQIRTAFEFENILGRSKPLQDVLQQANTVAETDATVLILGETGTGKELIARAIHDRSLRHEKAFIKVDCSTIPASLLESELFGHEKGAFTGAIEQKLGRFEIADRGTLFLDEVGDVPLGLQTKLLRVLQDRAFERLGSNRTLHLDLRVIAATNRDLEHMVGKGEFRADLYYRLKVFPITIPPLRERRDDIPLLVWHYVRKYAQRMRKAIDTIPAGAMDVFTAYPWPGNVRELQHFIERSVILTSGNVLRAPLRELERVIRSRPAMGTPPKATRSMEEIERESILQALRESNWVVGGPHGAAAKLGMKRTTLASRIERLGISRRP